MPKMPKKEKKLTPLSYDELANMPKVDRFSAMRAGLSRLAEFDFRHEYPPVYHKFDVVVFWSHWVSANALQYSTWQNGGICSCFIEIPYPQNPKTLKAVTDILDDAIRGMKNSSPSKTCFRTFQCFRIFKQWCQCFRMFQFFRTFHCFRGFQSFQSFQCFRPG